jgi:hypothetical protein
MLGHLIWWNNMSVILGLKRVNYSKRLSKGVFFIDKAYCLDNGRFVKEAIDELVGLLTQEMFRGKLIVILAGYDNDVNRLMSVNAGLVSRFTKETIFANFSPQRCVNIFAKEIKKAQVQSSELERVSSPEVQNLIGIFRQLGLLPSWGDAHNNV